ncbi:hypothetical protein FRC08_015335 [Ceratobasidium sp. 394]|nr:hypothetical protein FRC08_015335 [Ceratobasidium sp. 394]
MVTEALRLMPDVISLLSVMNTSVPPTWGNIDDYVIAVLGRSYSGAWSALTEFVGSTSPPLASKCASVVSMQAHITLWRVYLWLGIQLLATVAGVLFLMVQSRSENRLVGDTTLAAFHLDTTTVPRRRPPNGEGLLKLQKGQGRLEVVIVEQGSDLDAGGAELTTALISVKAA